MICMKMCVNLLVLLVVGQSLVSAQNQGTLSTVGYYLARLYNWGMVAN